MATTKPSSAGKQTWRNPWLFVPTAYFMQGLPVMLIQGMLGTMYKDMGVSNTAITFWTGLITWPWIIKMFWGPLVESFGTRRNWVIAMQGFITLALALTAFAIGLPNFFQVTLVILLVAAFLSATHDIALDGFYLLAMDKARQAFFVGVRSASFRLATIFNAGVIVVMAGTLQDGGMEKALSWTIAVLTGAGLYGLLWIYGMFMIPKPQDDAPVANDGSFAPQFLEAVVSFFRQDRIFAVLFFILFYRLGESMISAVAPLFLLDPIDKGGLQISLKHQGIIYGTVGVIALTIGGLLGGVIISRFGIKRCIWPMVLCLNVPNLAYVWAAITQPDIGSVYTLIAIDQFGYGFGFAAYLVYLMFISQGTKYSTSHYAIATGLMALGAMGAKMISGYLQQFLGGYSQFFVAVCILTIPGMISLLFIPMDKEDIKEAQVEID